MEHENKPLNEFQAWPKIPRFGTARMIITEKLDGTNGCVVIRRPDPIMNEKLEHELAVGVHDGCSVYLSAQSRNRFLPVGKGDNYGFAAWVQRHAEELVLLGPGRWYGEWFGLGIGRGYDLETRRFALFNAHHEKPLPTCVERVPLLYFGELDATRIKEVHENLISTGSQAVPGYMKPEGVVVQVLNMPGRMKITDAVQGQKHAE